MSWHWSPTPCWPSTPREPPRGPYLDRLESLRQTSKDGKLVWWGSADSPSWSRRTLFFGAGASRQIETTALASLALLNAGRSPESVRGALAWLVAQKDGHGTWGSTQATVLALKTLLAGTGKPLGGDQPRRIAILLDGEIVQELAIPADQADVMRQVDLSARVADGAGDSPAEDRGPLRHGFRLSGRLPLPRARHGRRPGREGGSGRGSLDDPPGLRPHRHRRGRDRDGRCLGRRTTGPSRPRW